MSTEATDLQSDDHGILPSLGPKNIESETAARDHQLSNKSSDNIDTQTHPFSKYLHIMSRSEYSGCEQRRDQLSHPPAGSAQRCSLCLFSREVRQVFRVFRGCSFSLFNLRTSSSLASAFSRSPRVRINLRPALRAIAAIVFRTTWKALGNMHSSSALRILRLHRQASRLP